MTIVAIFKHRDIEQCCITVEEFTSSKSYFMYAKRPDNHFRQANPDFPEEEKIIARIDHFTSIPASGYAFLGNIKIPLQGLQGTNKVKWEKTRMTAMVIKVSNLFCFFALRNQQEVSLLPLDQVSSLEKPRHITIFLVRNIQLNQQGRLRSIEWTSVYVRDPSVGQWSGAELRLM